MMNEQARHRSGMIGTIVFHAILLIIFLFTGFSKPEPIPGDEGILVNFGYDETGAGELEPQGKQVAQKEKQPSTPPETATETGKEEVMTQDFEEAPTIDKKEKEKKKKEKKQEPTPKQELKPQQEKQEPKKEKQIVDPNALYKGRSDNQSTGGEGITKGEGNQGSVTGEENVNNYADANSRGKGGVSYSLSGRNPQVLPKPEYQFQKEGKVVVEIKVNRQGNVISANPGVKGSTTLDGYLLKVAKKAALQSQFNTDKDAPAYQKGTITYYFKLN